MQLLAASARELRRGLGQRLANTERPAQQRYLVGAETFDLVRCYFFLAPDFSVALPPFGFLVPLLLTGPLSGINLGADQPSGHTFGADQPSGYTFGADQPFGPSGGPTMFWP